MARTQAADYEERREAILDKAAALFAKSGFLGSSVSDIARACKTSKSLLYHYYPSKDDVLYAVMLSHIDALLSDVEGLPELSGSAQDRLRLLLRMFMKHYIGAANRQKVLLNELGNLPEDRKAVIVSKQRRIVDAVQSLLVHIHPELGNSSKQARAKTMLLFGMINWTMTWYDPAGGLSVDELVDMIVDMTVAG